MQGPFQDDTVIDLDADTDTEPGTSATTKRKGKSLCHVTKIILQNVTKKHFNFALVTYVTKIYPCYVAKICLSYIYKYLAIVYFNF